MRKDAIPAAAFRNLYQSIVKYCSNLTDKREIRYILCHAYIANYDASAKAGVGAEPQPMPPEAFMALLKEFVMPYRTSVQLCKSIRYLLAQMDEKNGCAAARRAAGNLRYWYCSLADSFYEAHGVRVDSNQSVYRLCHKGLTPQPDEPDVPLLCYMPDAYARLRRKYLMEYQPQEYRRLLLAHRLNAHLATVNRHAQETRALLEHNLLDTPSACGRSESAIGQRYFLREKVEEMLLSGIIFNDRLWADAAANA